jgi:LysM repeat protein
MKHLLHVFAIALLVSLLLSACGPTTPAPAQPTQVAQIEEPPTVARPAQAPSTPLTATTVGSSGCSLPAGWSTYTVKSGDTLIALAKQVNRTVEELMQANCLTSPTIGVGSPLYLPLESCAVAPPKEWSPYTVRSGDTLFSLAAARGTTVAEVKRINCLVSDNLDVGKQLYLPPAPPAPPAPAVPAQAAQPQGPAIAPGGNSDVTLPSEVFFSGGGGGPNECYDTPTGILPVLEVEGLAAFRGDQLILCAYGFPNDEDLTIIFYTDRATIGTDVLRVTSDNNGGGSIASVKSGAAAGYVYPGTSNLALFPWWPLDVPDPVYVQVNSASKVARQVIRSDQLGPRAGFLQTAGYAPFAERFPPRKTCSEVTPGATLWFLGAGFKPELQIPIGLYVVSEIPANNLGMTVTLSAAGQTVVDGAGRFQYPISITPIDRPGAYYAMAVTNPIENQTWLDPQTDCYIIP